MRDLSSWGRAFRRVEVFFKHIIGYGQSLCPLDSRIMGSGPWVCYVCSDIRRRLRGQKNSRNLIVSGGKRYNKRGKTQVWFFPVKMDGEWVFNDPTAMVCATWCTLKRRKIAETLGEGFQFKVVFLTGLNVVGMLISNYESSQSVLQVLYSPYLSSSLSSEFDAVFYSPPSEFPQGYLSNRIEHAHNVLKRLVLHEASPS